MSANCDLIVNNARLGISSIHRNGVWMRGKERGRKTSEIYFIPPCVIVYPITNTAASAAIDTQIATTSSVVNRMFCR
jgi:hypothetical protein